MKKITHLILCAGMVLWMGSCTRNANTGMGGTDTTTSEEVKQEADEAKKDIKDAGRDAGDAIEEAAEDVKEGIDDATDNAANAWEKDRTTFGAETREKTRLLDQKIDKLNAKMNKAGVKSKAKMKEDLADLKAKRENLDTEMNRMDNAKESVWQDIKDGATKAYNDLEKAVDRAEDKFKND